MRQLTYIKPKTLSWWEVPAPKLCGPAEALVRPFIAGRCDGDSVFLRHNLKPVLRAGAALHVVDPAFGNAREDIFHGPFAYGHECVAEVMAVGPDVRDHALNDVVILPWSLSCGACARCTCGLTSNCERSKTGVAAYGLGAAVGGNGGMVSDVVRVPYADAMLVSVPKSIDPLLVASASDNMSDAYRAVAPQLARNPGAPVLIVGGAAKSIGLYAAGIAVALGASRVDYLDTDNSRLHIAESMGAHAIEVRGRARWLGMGHPIITEGYPIVVQASGSPTGLTYALTSLAPGGVCTAVAFYMLRGTPLPLWNMYLKSATLHVGVSHPRAHLPELLRLIEQGSFDPAKLRPMVGDWDDGDRVFLEDATKIVVRRRPLALANAGGAS